MCGKGGPGDDVFVGVRCLLTKPDVSLVWNAVFQHLRKGRGGELTGARHCLDTDTQHRVCCEYQMR